MVLNFVQRVYMMLTKKHNLKSWLMKMTRLTESMSTCLPTRRDTVETIGEVGSIPQETLSAIPQQPPTRAKDPISTPFTTSTL